MKDVKDNIRRELYKKYKFISENISEFENIIFSNVNFNETNDVIYKNALNNIEEYIIKNAYENNLNTLIINAIKYMSFDDTFTLFNRIFQKHNIDYSLINLEAISSIKELKDNFNLLLQNNKGDVENFKFSFIRNNFLQLVFENYCINNDIVFSAEEESNDDRYFNDSAERLYIREISKIPSLSKEEELGLFKKIEQGDMDAKEEVIRRNLKYVVYVAHKYVGQTHDLTLLDLIQYGNIGLMNAFDYYDYKLGYRFLTYATSRIMKEIQDGIKETGRTIRLSNGAFDKLRQLNKSYAKLRNKLFREPTDEELAMELNIDVDKVREIKTFNVPYVQLDQGVNEDERSDSENYYNFISDDTLTDTLLSKYEREEVMSIVEEILSEYNEVTKYIVIHGLGLYGAKSKSLIELKEKTGYSHETCRIKINKFINTLIQRLPNEEYFLKFKEKEEFKYQKEENIFPNERVYSRNEYFLNKKLTKEEYEYHNMRYKILKDIGNAKLIEFDSKSGKIGFQCKTCDFKWYTHYDRFKLDLECPHCKVNDKVKYYLDCVKTFNKDAEIKGKFVHPNDRVPIYCHRCGAYGNFRLDSYIRNGCKCKKCNVQNKEFVKEIETIINFKNNNNYIDFNNYGYVNTLRPFKVKSDYYMNYNDHLSQSDIDKLAKITEVILSNNGELTKIKNSLVYYNDIIIYMFDNGYINYKLFTDDVISNYLSITKEEVNNLRNNLEYKLKMRYSQDSVYSNGERIKKKIGEM